MHAWWFALCLVILMGMQLCLAIDPIYVATDGSDTMGDGTKDNPFKTIKKALGEAELMSTEDVVPIYVEEGNYPADGNSLLTYDGSVYIQAAADGGLVTIDLEGEDHFFQGSGETDENDLFWTFGLSDVTLKNSSNTALVLVNYNSIIISSCKFEFCGVKDKSDVDGGAVRITAMESANSGLIRIEGSEFLNNTAGYGGAVHVSFHNAAVYLDAVTFKGNMAEDDGGAMIVKHAKSASLTKVVLSSNQAAEGDGGGLMLQGEGNGEDVMQVFAETVTANGNKAGRHGGGLACSNTAFAYSDDDASTFIQNIANSGSGGGMYLTGNLHREGTEDNVVVFIENYARQGGGAMYFMSLDHVSGIFGNFDMLDNSAPVGGQQFHVDVDTNDPKNGNFSALTLTVFNASVTRQEGSILSHDWYQGYGAYVDFQVPAPLVVVTNAILPTLYVSELSRIRFDGSNLAAASTYTFNGAVTMEDGSHMDIDRNLTLALTSSFFYYGGTISLYNGKDGSLSFEGSVLVKTKSKATATSSHNLYNLDMYVRKGGSLIIDESQALSSDASMFIDQGGEVDVGDNANLTYSEFHCAGHLSITTTAEAVTPVSFYYSNSESSTLTFEQTSVVTLHGGGRSFSIMKFLTRVCFGGQLEYIMSEDTRLGGTIYYLADLLQGLLDGNPDTGSECYFDNITVHTSTGDNFADFEATYGVDYLTITLGHDEKEGLGAGGIIGIIIAVIALALVLGGGLYYMQNKRIGPYSQDEYDPLLA